MIRRFLALAAVSSIALSACVTVFPKAEPATLYQLTVASHPIDRPAGAVPVGVLRTPTAFPRTSTGDRIVTATGNETASIADARWAAPAQILFDEAMVKAFDASPRIRLATRGGPTPSDHTLRVEVRTFEARYPNADPKAVPTVEIEIKATLTNPPAAGGVAEQMFKAEVPASANRVSAIVDAYNAATEKVLDDLVSWTESAAAAS